MYEKNTATYHVDAVYQDLGAEGGVAFRASSIKCFFFFHFVSVNTVNRGGKVLFLSYLCLPLLPPIFGVLHLAKHLFSWGFGISSYFLHSLTYA